MTPQDREYQRVIQSLPLDALCDTLRVVAANLTSAPRAALLLQEAARRLETPA
jgi:hypothetical protein